VIENYMFGVYIICVVMLWINFKLDSLIYQSYTSYELWFCNSITTKYHSIINMFNI